ncbi:MAG: hypothetical protein IJV05_04575 [Muribaculaceae bacterium]|nr:hypothetical protein [Muribaculaceae bacterium]
MKRFLLYVALLLGSLIAQAQPAVEFHDVTAAITDSVRIVPNFSLGDTRSYRATVKTEISEARSDSSSVDYHMKVESVDPDHYGLLLTLDNFDHNPSRFPDTGKLIECCGTEGFHFFFNRHSLKVDSIDCSNLVKPLKEFLIKVSSGINQALDEDSTQLFIDNELDSGINEMAKKLLEETIQTWADQYGRTYAMGGSRWIETDEDFETIEVEDIDATNEDEELPEGEDEDMPDLSSKEVHQAFAHINEDGTFFYREKISWESVMLDNWFEVQEASFDANGWPIEITSTITMGETNISIHWQLINEND